MENEIKIEQKLGIHNRWDIEVIDAATGEVKQTARGYNVICNGWWSTFFSTATNDTTIMCYNIAFGSGTGTPAETDTALFHYEGQKVTANSSGPSVTINESVDSFYGKYSIQLGTGEFNGIEISEVGFRNSANTLCTHAVLKDMNGNPISIEKTEYDIINIYGTIYCHYDLDDYFNKGIMLQFNSIYMWKELLQFDDRRNPLMFHILGGRLNETSSSYEQSRPILTCLTHKYFYSKNIKSLLTNPPGSQYGSDGYSIPSANWVININSLDKKASYSLKFDVGDCNFGRGIGILSPVYNTYMDNSEFMNNRASNPIALFCGREFPNCWWQGTQITGEVVGTGDGSTKKFKTAYDFPYNATVKVNGNAVTGVTVREMPSIGSNSSDFGLYLKSVDSFRSSDGHLYPLCGGYLSSDVSKTVGLVSPGYGIIYNPFYNEIGVIACGMYNTSAGYDDLLASNDLVTWELVIDKNTRPSSGYTINIPDSFKHYKYWKQTVYNSDNNYKKCLILDSSAYDGYNIIFDEAPDEGDVVTIDYTTPYIAKDSNHVFNLTYVLSFNDYTPEE